MQRYARSGNICRWRGKSYGFRSPDILEMALYHALGKLPEPKLTHEFY